MGNEGAKLVYTQAEVAALIAAHAADYTKHVKIIRKTADQTVNNSETLQDDDELFLPLGANEVWFFIFLPIFYSSANADFSWGLVHPDGALLHGWISYQNSVGAVAGEGLYEEEFSPVAGVDTDSANMIFLGLIINGATAGNLQLQWAQYAAEESDTIVRKNSCMLAWKLA